MDSTSRNFLPTDVCACCGQPFEQHRDTALMVDPHGWLPPCRFLKTHFELKGPELSVLPGRAKSVTFTSSRGHVIGADEARFQVLKHVASRSERRLDLKTVMEWAESDDGADRRGPVTFPMSEETFDAVYAWAIATGRVRGRVVFEVTIGEIVVRVPAVVIESMLKGYKEHDEPEGSAQR